MRAPTLLLLLAGLAGLASAANYDTLCATHVVQSGDSLWSIANQYAVTQEDLTDALSQCLPGWNSGVALQVGQKICLPGYVPACEYVIDSGDVSGCKAYQIQSGDTLLLIASVFGVYSEDLKDINPRAASGVLQVGTFVRLPPWDDSRCPDVDATAPDCRVYAVQTGDFVFGIASIFRVGVDALLAVNPGLAIDTYLQAGMRIRVPPFTSSCGNGFLATPPTTGVFSCRAYRVRTGDSLAAIALAFQTTVAAVVAANPELADPSLLTPGKLVRIPPYPGDCINGILISFSGSTPVQAGPVSVPVIYNPTPATPSPSAPTGGDVYTGTPSVPAPTTASPSPAAASPSPASPASPTAGPAPSTGLQLRLVVTGTTPSAVIAQSAAISSGVAALLGCPSAWVSVSASAARRRLQAAGDTAVVVSIASATPSADAAKLQSAAASLASLFASLGLSADASTMAISLSPAASPVAATPAPASPGPSAPAGSGTAAKSSNTGAIIGGVVGGVGGFAAVCAVAFLIIKKRRAAASPASAYAGVTANVTSGGMQVKTRSRALQEDQGYSTSPRATGVTPRTRAGQMA